MRCALLFGCCSLGGCTRELVGGNKIGMVSVQYWLNFLCFVLLNCNDVRTLVRRYSESCLLYEKVIKVKYGFVIVW